MTSPDTVMMVTEDAATEKAVSTALSGRTVVTCRDLTTLIIKLKQAPAAAVLVDIERQPDRILAELQPLISDFRETRFIVVAPELRNDWLLRAMEAGARHFLLKQDIPSSLGEVFQRLVPEAARPRRSGSAVTVLSAGGGCGATMLAINLAYELTDLAPSAETLLVDLDEAYGAVAGYLGLRSDYGIADVLENEERIDEQLIRSTAVPYQDGLEVLVSPAVIRPLEHHVLRYDNLSRLLQESRRAYDFTVVDAPRVPLQAMVNLAAASAVTLLVFELNVEDIRVAQMIRRGLREHDVPEAAILVVASRWRKRHDMITINESQRALGGCRLVALSNDFRSASASINYGKPMAEVAPRSPLRRDIRALANNIRDIDTATESLRGVA